jgi:hypothetical protein
MRCTPAPPVAAPGLTPLAGRRLATTLLGDEAPISNYRGTVYTVQTGRASGAQASATPEPGTCEPVRRGGRGARNPSGSRWPTCVRLTPDPLPPRSTPRASCPLPAALSVCVCQRAIQAWCVPIACRRPPAACRLFAASCPPDVRVVRVVAVIRSETGASGRRSSQPTRDSTPGV